MENPQTGITTPACLPSRIQVVTVSLSWKEQWATLYALNQAKNSPANDRWLCQTAQQLFQYILEHGDNSQHDDLTFSMEQCSIICHALKQYISAEPSWVNEARLALLNLHRAAVMASGEWPLELGKEEEK